MFVNLDNYEVKQLNKKIKYLKFLSLVKEYKTLSFKDEWNKELVFIGDNNDTYNDLNYDHSIGFNYIRNNIFGGNNGSMTDLFDSPFYFDSEDEDDSEYNKKINYLTEVFDLSERKIDKLLEYSSEDVILIYKLYNEKISKVIELSMSNEINVSYKELKKDILSIFSNGLNNYEYIKSNIISYIENKDKKNSIGLIIKFEGLYNLHYCSYDMYMFYKKCEKILKEYYHENT